MGSSCSRDDSTNKDKTLSVFVKNDIYLEVEKWNNRREDVLKNLHSLSQLYMTMHTRKERIRFIEDNLEVFQEFFNLPHIEGDIFHQIEHMFQSGLQQYIKPKK